MSTARTWHDRDGLVLSVQGFRTDLGTTRYQINPGGPVQLGIWFRGNQLPIGAVENVKEPVLIGLHDDLSILVVDSNIREGQLLHAIEVPRIAGHKLTGLASA